MGIRPDGGINNGPAGVEPVGEAAGVGGTDALGHEEAGGDAGTRPRGAVEQDFAAAHLGQKLRPLGAGPGEIAERKEPGRLRDTIGPLPGLTDVDEEGLAVADAVGAFGGRAAGRGGEGGLDHFE